MGFKIAMAAISDNELQKIRDDRPTGGYDGPTPPPGRYQMRVAKVWVAETKTGRSVIKVSYVIDEDKDSPNSAYNGASTIENYIIPDDPSDKNFTVFVSRIDTFLNVVSNGKMSYREFQDASTSGRTDVDKRDKIGIPIKQIGNLKFTGDIKVIAKTKIRQYNGKDYIDIHDLVNSEPQKKSEDLDLDLDDSADDELDNWLEG